MDDRNRTLRLLRSTASLSGISLDAARTVGRLVAGSLPDGGIPATSTLNNDGFPLQLCLSGRPGGMAVRLLGDPGWAVSASRQRLTRSLAACRALVQARASADLHTAIDLAIAYGLPAGGTCADAFDAGAIWLATGAAGRGFAAYLNVRWTDAADCWRRSLAWLDAALPAGWSRQALAGIERCATPVSIAVEGESLADARVKLYVRLVRPASLQALGVEPLRHAALARFIADAVGSGSLPGSGLNIALGWETATGVLSDAKVDICAHCVPRRPREWAALSDSVADACGLQALPLEKALSGGHMAVALVGLGIDRYGAARFNAYLRAA